jgi:proteasome accessory factor C
VSGTISDVERYLVLVPLLAQAGPRGLPVSEVAEICGLPPDPQAVEAWLADFVEIGVPGGSPDELVDVGVEGDRVVAFCPLIFDHPVRLSRDEALALVLTLEQARRGGPPQVTGLADRLRSRLLAASVHGSTSSTLPSTEAIAVVPAADEPDAVLSILHSCAVRRERISMRYYTATRDDVTVRSVKPHGLLRNMGFWYLVGTDESGSAKLFRVDRVGEVEPTGVLDGPEVDVPLERFEAPNRFVGTEDVEITLMVAPGADLTPAEIGSVLSTTPGPDGSALLVLRTASVASVSAAVRRAAGRVRVVRPVELAETIASQAEALADRYGTAEV